MDVIRINPRGYCYGVVDALQLAKQVAAMKDVPRPIYVLGQIVHNRHAVESLEAYGIRTLDGAGRLELLDGIDSGTVIFTAHGVAPEVKQRAREKGLRCFDATCPDVTRSHDLVRRLAADGFEILYIGKKGHPEPEGVLGEAPEHVHLVGDEADLDALDLPQAERLAVVTQTTLSQWDTARLIEEMRRRFPGVRVYNEICLATQQRQEAAVAQSREADLVLVVGDRRSNNSNRLVQVVREIAGRPAYLIDSVEDIDPRWLRGTRRVAVTAGSSTPSQLTREVIAYLEALEPEPAGA
ncbi:4-hydroxy-3-methylbut-2-enyl diphosphate reductase [Limnochorda pilosa]|uniref:4-hydroxy-3-methylbut-2-enyl diphosphate reductase n=1 Tax=Limnochorda pilosa TaxID=1555112 RepID=A0A0K2SG13_LIMPI|nr:4-hydroxy-3-methylbut-2-enyl diphosphate reductase [Limnochorda pilosa]BAS25977.1 4-hydroxy-3-methylbut-2-enyl diphosphate reductase [Limnochorda pilosa]